MIHPNEVKLNKENYVILFNEAKEQSPEHIHALVTQAQRQEFSMEEKKETE